MLLLALEEQFVLLFELVSDGGEVTQQLHGARAQDGLGRPSVAAKRLVEVEDDGVVEHVLRAEDDAVAVILLRNTTCVIVIVTIIVEFACQIIHAGRFYESFPSTTSATK